MNGNISKDLRNAISRFSLWLANGTLGHSLLDGIEYSDVLHEPSAMEMIYAVFINNLKINSAGAPQNAKYAEHRAAQWLRAYCDPSYVAEPPFEDFECEVGEPSGENGDG